MSPESLVDELVRAIREAERSALPRVGAALKQAELELLLRLQAVAPMRPPDDTPREHGPVRLISPDEAATIAGVPKRRMYAWAKGQRWAHRPTRKTLRIDEGGFRRWLIAKGGQ